MNEALNLLAKETSACRTPEGLLALHATVSMALRQLSEATAELKDVTGWLDRLEPGLISTAFFHRLALAVADARDDLARRLAVMDPADTAEDGSGLGQVVKEHLTVLNVMLESVQVERLLTVGQPFDPIVHAAFGTAPTDDPAMHRVIAEETQAGYRHGEALLRPAQVIVGIHQKKKEEVQSDE